jgi:DHA1 family multidrug resistance protein-like MFS transporter
MGETVTTTSKRLIDSWVWLLVLYSFASFIEASFWGQMGAFTPLYLPKLGITNPDDIKAWTGYIVAISGLVGIPFLPLWGALADRYSRQPIIIRSFVVHMLAGIVSILAGNVVVFLIGRSLMSFSLGNTGLMMTTLSERAPKHRHGLAFSLMNSAGPIGAFIGPLLGGPVVDRLGFPALLAINVSLLLIVILVLTFGYRDHFKGTAQAPLMSMMKDSVQMIWNSKRLRTLFPALFMLFGGWMMAFTYVPIGATELYYRAYPLGTDPNSAVGVVMGAGGIITLLLSPIIGTLADRYGHWRVLFIGSIVAIVLWPVPSFMRELVPFTIAWAVLNGVVSSVFALSFSVLSSSAPSHSRGRIMSFAYLPVNVGYIIGPTIGSLVTQVSTFAVFPAAAVLTAIGLGGLVLAYKQQMPSEVVAAE